VFKRKSTCLNLAVTFFWAKTLPDGTPGISVRDHCLNVGCVAEALIERLPHLVKAMLPQGAATLAALHDAGKVSAGFQSKCSAHLEALGLAERAVAERWADPAFTDRDHAKISQWYLQPHLRRAGRWALAVGAHHGAIYGRLDGLYRPKDIAACREWEKAGRDALLAEFTARFGDLPATAPREDAQDLWLLAGLISVADWMGSNEDFFPADRGLGDEASASRSAETLKRMCWGGGRMRSKPFAALFGDRPPYPLQQAIHAHAQQPGLYIVEGPMGCGKTEAALWAAHRLHESEANTGLYFALPTQVTSNRIHQRVERFLKEALDESAVFRLAHGASWLSEKQAMLLQPAEAGNAESGEHVQEGRSWFASAKHALLARYGVGTVDQALQGVVAVKHFFVRRFGLAGKVVVLDEVHSYDVYTSTLITHLIHELLALRCAVIVLSATLTQARRAELIAAAGGDAEAIRSNAYPLLTVALAGEPLVEKAVEPPAERHVALRYCHLEPKAVLQECLQRAEQGQHVLYLRNTVAEAQEACRLAQGMARDGRVKIGLLHSRFPFFRREELEGEWLERLGTQRAQDGMGSLLIATQVVEQSVDIDLDFIVSDLAPTDMLLQRMGRLWRHPRQDRCGARQEFWINAPTDVVSFARTRDDADATTSAAALKKALGKSGKVYAPYVLLRTAAVFAAREAISLPSQIREVLEATYNREDESEESPAWKELREELEKDLEQQKQLANSATNVLGQQSRKDAEGLMTRREGAPSRDVILLSACERVDAGRWQLTGLDGETVSASEFDWRLDVARLLSRNLVRVPRYQVPRQEMPPWLRLHTHGLTAFALVQSDGGCVFPEAQDKSPLAYTPALGLYPQPGAKPIYHEPEDDYEFDD
jgi:CRISPR-associated endonuclease/helicase Cas3